MGQQQLLLIVLGVIVVGIAVVVGIYLFSANSISANRDGVTSDLNNLGAMAQQYYKKPISMGGGGSTFTGLVPWEIPTGLDSTPNGTYAATVAAQSVTIVGTGTEIGTDGVTNIRHTAVVSALNVNITQQN